MILDTETKRVAHLLRRAGLGASRAELEMYSPLGVSGAVEALLGFESIAETYAGLDGVFVAQNGQLRPQALELWWIYRLLTTKRPLQERMTLFWHDHFATSGEKVQAGRLMLEQNELFRRMALGNFRDMLVAVSRDPAMILWLDNNTNVKGKPNENYAREVMELFTMGVGNYSEKDIQEAARAFTGWTIANRGVNVRQRRATFQFRAGQHDFGQKTILGQTGAFDGLDVCDILARHPISARYLCKKLWEFFAYPDPEKPVLDALVKTYFDSGLNMKDVMRRLFTSNSFYSDKAVRSLYKSPFDFTIDTLRALGIAKRLPNLVPAADEEPKTVQQQPPAGKAALAALRVIAMAMHRMGMQLFFPPSVAGWEWGKAWINSATMLERMKFADAVFATAGTLSGPAGSRVPRPGAFRRSIIQARDLTSGEKLEAPPDLIRLLLSLLDIEMPATKQKQLVTTVENAGGMEMLDTGDDAARLLDQLAKLIFASPEFQYC